ncbi:MAG TPA: hypothetical protein VJT31_35230, partial [Rugosimonospora sp.]|nr:hypothetical protein [Rugosimonospora sp.]
MPSDRGTGGAAPDPAARRLREAAARFTERYEDILPPEVVAAVVWAAAEDMTGALPGGTEPAPDQVTQIVARAGADLAMAAG